jgi:hypothetical protein
LDKVTQGDGSLDGWAQRLYNAVFPGASQSLMSCITRDAPCTIPEQCRMLAQPQSNCHPLANAQTEEFEAKGNAGVWYILQSLMNFGAYMSEYENGIETLRNSLNDEVAKLTKDFTIPSAKTTDVQLGAAIAGSLNLAGSTLDGKMAGVSVPRACFRARRPTPCRTTTNSPLGTFQDVGRSAYNPGAEDQRGSET